MAHVSLLFSGLSDQGDMHLHSLRLAASIIWKHFVDFRKGFTLVRTLNEAETKKSAVYS